MVFQNNNNNNMLTRANEAITTTPSNKVQGGAIKFKWRTIINQKLYSLRPHRHPHHCMLLTQVAQEGGCIFGDQRIHLRRMRPFKLSIIIIHWAVYIIRLSIRPLHTPQLFCLSEFKNTLINYRLDSCQSSERGLSATNPQAVFSWLLKTSVHKGLTRPFCAVWGSCTRTWWLSCQRTHKEMGPVPIFGDGKKPEVLSTSCD